MPLRSDMAWNTGVAATANGGIRSIRLIMFGLASAVLFIGVALAVAESQRTSSGTHHRTHLSSAVIVVVLVAVGVAAQLATRLVLKRQLSPRSEESLRASYMTRLFLAIGIGEVPLFVGVVLVAATGRFWPYLIGAASALLTQFQLYPSERHLARDQEELNRRGVSLELRGALATMPQRRR